MQRSSHPRPLWFTESLHGRSFKQAMGDTIFREQYTDAVTCVIPGAKRPDQVEDNSRAGDLPAIDHSEMEALRVIYDTYIRGLVHHRW